MYLITLCPVWWGVCGYLIFRCFHVWTLKYDNMLIFVDFSLFGMYKRFKHHGENGEPSSRLQFWCDRDGARMFWSHFSSHTSAASNAVKLHKTQAYFRLLVPTKISEAGSRWVLFEIIKFLHLESKVVGLQEHDMLKFCFPSFLYWT